jgi:hypothetical protein
MNISGLSELSNLGISSNIQNISSNTNKKKSSKIR